jgi:hypothetical protein
LYPSKRCARSTYHRRRSASVELRRSALALFASPIPADPSRVLPAGRTASPTRGEGLRPPGC